MHTYIYKSRHWVPSVPGPRELSAFLSHIIIKYIFLSSTLAVAGTDLCRILLEWFVNIHSNWGTYVCIYILGWFIYSTSFKKLMFDFKWNTARALRMHGTSISALFGATTTDRWQTHTVGHSSKWMQVEVFDAALCPNIVPWWCGLIGIYIYIYIVVYCPRWRDKTVRHIQNTCTHTNTHIHTAMCAWVGILDSWCALILEFDLFHNLRAKMFRFMFYGK